MGCAAKLSDAAERALHKKDSIDFAYTGALCWLTVGKLLDYCAIGMELFGCNKSKSNPNQINQDVHT